MRPARQDSRTGRTQQPGPEAAEQATTRHADIIRHFESDALRQAGFAVQVLSTRFDSTRLGPLPMAFDSLTYRHSQRHVRWHVVIASHRVRAGLPRFRLDRRVAGSKAIGKLLALLGLRPPALPFGDPRLDRRIERLVAEPASLHSEACGLFAPGLCDALAAALEAGFDGSIVYDSASLELRSTELPTEPEQQRAVDLAIDVLLALRVALAAGTPDPARAIRRTWETTLRERAWEAVHWHTPSGGLPYPEYPPAVHAFIGTLSAARWTDTQYATQPVVSWLQHPAAIACLPETALPALLTHLVRSERFCDGAWESAWRRGWFAALLKHPLFRVAH